MGISNTSLLSVDQSLGFMKVLRGKMDMEGREYKAYWVNTHVKQAEALRWPADGKERLEHFAKEMEEYRRKSRESKPTEESPLTASKLEERTNERRP
jgi:hypothetical protein